VKKKEAWTHCTVFSLYASCVDDRPSVLTCM